MTEKKEIKQTARFLILIYLISSVFMTIGMEHHALKHDQSMKHKAEHATLTCNWLCTAFAFVHSPDQQTKNGFITIIAKLSIFAEQLSHDLTVLPHNARPPPLFLS
ncbi:MAG: hypothetical protein ACE5FZ_07765 [Nitrospiria bacterium]